MCNIWHSGNIPKQKVVPRLQEEHTDNSGQTILQKLYYTTSERLGAKKEGNEVLFFILHEMEKLLKQIIEVSKPGKHQNNSKQIKITNQINGNVIGYGNLETSPYNITHSPLYVQHHQCYSIKLKWASCTFIIQHTSETG